MATTGKKISSSAAVACVWIGGSGLAQLIYLGVVLVTVKKRGESGDAGASWAAVPAPAVAAFGGAMAVWLLRRASGWPKLPILKLFIWALCASVFSLALMPWGVPVVALVAGVLALGSAMVLTWREAGAGSLGTRLFAGSTKVKEEETNGGTADQGK